MFATRSNQSDEGAVAVFVAVIMTVLIAMVGLVADVGIVFVTRSRLQTAADAAALGAVTKLEIGTGTTVSTAIRLANANFPNAGTVTGASDVVVGRWNDATNTFSAGGSSPNAVRVTAAQSSNNGNPVPLLFMPVVGRTEADVEVSATAALMAATAGEIVPAALRSPGFPPIDPEIVEENPGKSGPSFPSNGANFVFGEEVVLFTFGKGKQSPVHLVLDIQGVDVSKVLAGEDPSPRISIGDTFPVVGEGTGQGGLGGDLADRLDFASTDPRRHVLVPIVEQISRSRNGSGELSGSIRVADLAAVFLVRVERTEVPDPDKPGETIEIEVLIGRIETAVVIDGGGGSTPSGTGGGLVRGVALVE